MTRFFAILLTLAVLCGMMTVMASAAENTVLTITSKVTSAKPGDVIEFKIEASGGKCTSFGLVLEYDSNVFEVVEGKCTLKDKLFSIFDKEKGLAVMFEEETALDGEVGTFVLKVKSGAPSGKVEVSGVSSVKNGNADVTSEVEPAKLTISGGAAQSGNSQSSNSQSNTPAQPSIGEAATTENADAPLPEEPEAPAAVEEEVVSPEEPAADVEETPAEEPGEMLIMPAPQAPAQEETKVNILIPAAIFAGLVLVLIVILVLKKKNK